MSYYPLRYERILVHNWLPHYHLVVKLTRYRMTSSLVSCYSSHFTWIFPWTVQCSLTQPARVQENNLAMSCVMCTVSLYDDNIAMMCTLSWETLVISTIFLNLKRVADRQFSRLRGGECRWISCLFCLLSNKIRMGRRPVVINIIENIKRESLGHQDITSWSVIGV